ncbi:MAG TPA: type VI secretion system tip protein TssI/VgrG [Burkholderiaceae bacterium]|nr:type VI secretion system tip protein TssI/VgrG [Burkholderiaceae bacterium]HMX10143.1 type VI secretion system tip protein TssI/VgrG [Burkholderiaceae bacterium]HMZ00181.1 type VI secretion system tip protein TssI/VgrG [Burkholderiaceae bacterium]HNB43580.1 type VI secretion system tip protein TssI/VgrG [Burkholderiaceae bacterium]HNG78763.1 type VI secretion system tip protein TssI/VgrG [Burkholderiaceae bacterium]
MAAAITFQSPLPPQELFVESMTVDEGLSQLGSIELQLLSPRHDLTAERLLGKPVGIQLEDRADHKRYFHGHVVRFGHGAAHGRFHAYHAEVRPWPWFLTRTADCRIFQDLSVPEIVRQVCDDHPGVAQLKLNLMRSYPKWTYCVQYRETDFQFISRLLEHEGIYWHIAHERGKHTLLLQDSSSAHDPVAGVAEIRHIENPATAAPGEQYVSAWRFDEEIQTEKVALTSYDFERPSTSLLTDVNISRSHPEAGAERFDFQGDYLQTADGKQLAEDLLDAEQTRYQRCGGEGNALNLEAGHTFTLKGHPRGDQNAKYLLTRVHLHAQVAVFDGGGGGVQFKASFEAIPAAQQFRPPRRTPKPVVQGPQTALVVGPAGEEIFTDKYGRVKLQFHWDRLGQKNDQSSCWVRVSQPWSGKNFGMIHTPRIGQEVVVSFLEGDPDQPLITGRVHNAEQMPPWELPANATQSGILTRSSKGGAYGNANAIRFEDKKGSEQLWIHAEKNQDIEVENDETHSVGHDRSKTIDHDETTLVKHDRTETVGNHETITIGVNRTESVGSNEVIGIGANRTESVGANETISIGANRTISVGASETASVALQRTHSVGVNETIAIGAAQEIAIGAAQVVAVGAAQTITVGANQSTSVGANQSNDIGANQSTSVGANQSTNVTSNRSIEVGGDQSTSVGKGRSATVANDDALKVGKNLVIDAGDSVTLKTGSASLTMKKDGTIVLKGKNITLDGSGKITVKASGDVVIKGSKVLQN